MKSMLIGAILLLPSVLQAQVGTEPARELLLPISSTFGGYGTHWSAGLIMLNDGDEVAEVLVDWQCSLPICPDGLTLDAGEWMAMGLEGGGRGNLLTVVRGDPQFSYRLYVRDSPTGIHEFQTELPIVPVQSLGNERLNLFKVDLPAGTRHALRVYDVSAAERPAVRVTASYMFSATGRRVAPGVIFFDEEVPLDGRSALAPAEAALFNFLPIPDSDILVTVRPLDPAMRIWAFLSVTDNLTQDLVLYTPQTPASRGATLPPEGAAR